MRYPLILLLLLFGATLGAGWLGAAFPADGWYADLAKPAWTPPGRVIGPVWSTLFVLMMVATWRVWLQPRGPVVGRALAVYGVQLALNGAWSWLFFGQHQLAGTLVLVGGLWAASILTLVLYRRADRWAGALLLPYVLWIAFDLVWLVVLIGMNR